MDRRSFFRKAIVALAGVAIAPHIQYSPITPASYDGDSLNVYIMDEMGMLSVEVDSPIYRFLMSHLRRRDVFECTTVEDLEQDIQH
jgi:hypothetical protein